VEDVARIRAHPLVPGGIPIYGYIYDVTSGRPDRGVRGHEGRPADLTAARLGGTPVFEVDALVEARAALHPAAERPAQQLEGLAGLAKRCSEKLRLLEDDRRARSAGQHAAVEQEAHAPARPGFGEGSRRRRDAHG